MPRDQWEMEQDARTLAEAGSISENPNRLRGAKKAAGKMLADKRAEIKALEQITSGQRPATSSEPKVTTVRSTAPGAVPFTRSVRSKGSR